MVGEGWGLTERGETVAGRCLATEVGPGRGRAPGSGASAGAGVGGERRGRVGRGGATGEERVGIWGERRDEAGKVRILG